MRTAGHQQPSRALRRCRRSDGGPPAISVPSLREPPRTPQNCEHFAISEDIALKLAVQSTARRADMVERAALLHGLTRERLVGIGSVIREVMPHHMRHELLIFEDGIRDKSSLGLVQELRSHEGRIVAAIVGVIRDAVVAGDLSLPDDLPPEKLGLAVMQIEIGAHVLMRRSGSYGRYTPEDSYQVLLGFGISLADSLGWKPLSSEHDIQGSTRRMWREIFPAELERFGIKA